MKKYDEKKFKHIALILGGCSALVLMFMGFWELAALIIALQMIRIDIVWR